MSAILLAAALVTPYAATPQMQAVSIVSFGALKPPIVVRVNRVGRYATVLTSGGRMEGAAVTAPLLLERFGFGWQALDLLGTMCDLQTYRLPPGVEAALLDRMPRPPIAHGKCDYGGDSGPRADVETVRQLMRGPLVPYVIVSGDWAIGQWYGGGGGERLYRRAGKRWRFVAGGGGAMSFAQVRGFGVPYRDACALRLYDAKCE